MNDSFFPGGFLALSSHTYHEAAAADRWLRFANRYLLFILRLCDDFDHAQFAPLLFIADKVFYDLFVP